MEQSESKKKLISTVMRLTNIPAQLKSQDSAAAHKNKTKPKQKKPRSPLRWYVGKTKELDVRVTQQKVSMRSNILVESL